MNKRRKIITALSLAVVLVITAFTPINQELFVLESKAASVSISDVKPCHVSEEDIQSFTLHDETTEQEFREEVQISNSGISLFALSETIYDTGLFKTTLSGLALDIYEAFESIEVNPANSGVKMNVSAPGKTYTEAYNIVSRVYAEGMYAYYYDHLEQFYWNGINGIGLGLTSSDGNYVATLYFTVSKYYDESIGNAADAKVNQAVSELSIYTTTYDRLYEINKWVVDNCEYDYAALEAETSTEQAYFAHSMVGLLVNGKGVCETYAKTFKILCQKFSIPCVVVVSKNHAFNYAKIDGNWYMVDCTWNDSYESYTRLFLISNNPAYDSSAHVETGPLVYPVTSSSNYVRESTEHHWDEGTVTKEATCEVAGLMLFQCTDSGCEETKSVDIEPIGHNYKEKETTATCTESGVTTMVCLNCDGATLKTEEPLGHDYSKYSVVTADDYASCTVYGICTRCGDKTFLTTGTTSVKEIVDATCLEEGYISIVNTFTIVTESDGTTTSRKITQSKKIVLDSLGHEWVMGEKVEATPKEDGYTLYHCSRCDEVEKRDFVVYVPKKDQSISVTKSGMTTELKTLSLDAEKSVQLSVSGNAKESVINYSSSNTAIAKVSSTGKITAIKPGTCTIQVKAGGTDTYNASNVWKISITVHPAVPKTVSVANVSNGVKIKWTKVSNATGYYIYRGSIKIGTISASGKITTGDKVLTSVKATTTVFTCIDTSVKNGSSYLYKVIPYASTGKTEGRNNQKIYRLSTPTISSLKSTVAGRMAVAYNKNSSAQGYQIQYDTTNEFTNAKLATVKDFTVVTKNISQLKSGKTYYVRVRSYKTVSGVNYYSGWSTIKSIKIK